MQSEQRNFKLMQSGLDYITLTSSNTNDGYSLYKIGCDFLTAEYRLGNRNKSIAPNGYKGTLCGHIFVGRSESGTLVRVSGKMSSEIFLAVQGLNVNCTRIDLQLTYDIGVDNVHFAHVEQQNAMLWRLRSKHNNLGHIRHIIGNGRGDTTQVGSRTSSRYGRLYDKYRESEDEIYRNCWRYEVELKSPLSQIIYDRLKEAPDREKVLRGVIKWQWSQWGFDVSFMKYKEEELAAPPLDPSDAEKKLEWIRRQVVPSLAYCVDKGYGAQLAMIMNEGSGLLCSERKSGSLPPAAIVPNSKA